MATDDLDIRHVENVSRRDKDEIPGQPVMHVTTVERGRVNPNEFHWPMLVVAGQSEQENRLVVIRSALVACPDQVPSTSTRGLLFISHAANREILLVDLGHAERALTNGEWKPATVFAASIVEALLLWAIQQHTAAQITTAIAAGAASADARKVKASLPPDKLLDSDWSFHAYIEVAFQLNEIQRSTADLCQRGRDYRNLIHAAAAERRKEQCDMSTAHAAIAAAYGTIRDLEAKHP
jgi:hypothetical protein